MASYPRPDAKVSRGPPVPVRRAADLANPINVVPLKPLLPAIAEKPVSYVRDSSEGLTAQPPRHISSKLESIAKPACEPPEEEAEYDEVPQEFQHPTDSAPNASASQDEAKGPSVFDISGKDVASFKPGDGVKDENEDINRRRRSLKAKDYGSFVKFVCCLSCLLCLWPVNFICLCLACYTCVKTLERNNERDYQSAHTCNKWALSCTIIALGFLIVSPIIIISIVLPFVNT